MKIEIRKFEKGKTIFDDRGGVTKRTPDRLHYSYDGCNYSVSEVNSSKESLITKAVETTAWNEWFYEEGGEVKTFSEIGLEPPIVETPEGDIEKVTSIGDFVNNCRGLMPKSSYEKILMQLKQIALKEIKIEVEE